MRAIFGKKSEIIKLNYTHESYTAVGRLFEAFDRYFFITKNGQNFPSFFQGGGGSPQRPDAVGGVVKGVGNF